MNIVVRSVQKYWTGGNTAATLLIRIPRSHVVGQASLTGVQNGGQEEVYARIVDARDPLFWSGPSSLGNGARIDTTTDLLALQVFAPGSAKAVGTCMLVQTLSFGGTIVRDLDAGLTGALTHMAWVVPGDDGAQAVHQVVTYEGADPVEPEFLERYLDRFSDDASALLPVRVDGDLFADPRVRLTM